MEKSSPYVLIGAAVMLFVAALVGFVIWKLRAGDQTSYAYYVILFSGDVQGLTADLPVYYRGLRVGRVADISLTSRIDVQRSTGRERLSEKIQVTVAVDSHIDIRERSYAVFEKPFIAGAAFVQIVGRVDVDQIKPKKKLGDKPYPEIREGASFLQVTSTSAQELLSQGRHHGRPAERAAQSRQHPGGQRFAAQPQHHAGRHRQAGRRHPGDAGRAAGRGRRVQQDLRQAQYAGRHAQPVAMEIGPQDAETKKALAGKEPSELRKTLAEARTALDEHRRRRGPAQQADRRQQGPHPSSSPRTAWSSYRYAIRELRQLTSNLNIIATKLERDPANFVFSGKQGYTPK